MVTALIAEQFQVLANCTKAVEVCTDPDLTLGPQPDPAR
jgi:hypothetical protein